MFYDNQTAICNANIPLFQERTKYIEVEGHFEPDMVMRKKIMALSQINWPVGRCFYQNLLDLYNKTGTKDL